MSREALIEWLVIIVLGSWVVALVTFAGLLVWAYVKDWLESPP